MPWPPNNAIPSHLPDSTQPTPMQSQRKLRTQHANQIRHSNPTIVTTSLNLLFHSAVSFATDTPPNHTRSTSFGLDPLRTITPCNFMANLRIIMATPLTKWLIQLQRSWRMMMMVMTMITWEIMTLNWYRRKAMCPWMKRILWRRSKRLLSLLLRIFLFIFS
ncbi:hypothetical protein WN944_019137 [Citrus x changshan-huyou]|uniref:Uncharacterized protein n=1 Tax=Citrus x changshan-huyou TaxID=2935761 RepID=A0AAP0LVD7_9ROSI